eukprot:CAMPEP_0113940322 /NCGR_PEP_ID=MMETSP1339-20121228/6477_1 /TAXON_ID=94617 /ORGANISM="Fibrocapsa japonica" /LENGTH=412 /DNA_ID=CAMNT_0000944119 /DNA_START=10 /DNA_END=1245 /DNA_ORIENTATION=- /assembly_acc=CAM_ASM_000762
MAYDSASQRMKITRIMICLVALLFGLLKEGAGFAMHKNFHLVSSSPYGLEKALTTTKGSASYSSRKHVFMEVYGNNMRVNFEAPGKKFGSVSKALDVVKNLFPCWVLSSAILGLLRPQSLIWFNGSCITWSLSFTMLCMGMTLEPKSFVRVLTRPKQVLAGVVCQYTIMPFLAYTMAKLYRLPPTLAAGVILVGCCPGGTASNLVTLIAKADVALSVTLTSISTLLACVVTPLMTSMLVGTLVPLDAKTLLVSTLQVVLAPVAAGLGLKVFAPNLCRASADITPVVGVFLVALICGAVVAGNAPALATLAPAAAATGAAVSASSWFSSAPARCVAALLSLHAGGFALGYFAPRAIGAYPAEARTVSIEVGMQNSALAAVLAAKAFSDPMIALPGAVSATCHSIMGSFLATLW